MALIILLTIWAAFFILEFAWPRKKRILWNTSFLVDLSFAVFNAIIFWEFWPNLNSYVQSLVDIPQVSIYSWGLVGQAVFIFLFVDFLSWVTHRMLHQNVWLWKVHRMHHTIKELNFLRLFYYNPIENIIYSITARLPLIFFAFNPQIFLTLGIIEASIGYLNHANTKIRVPVWLSKIINTPQVHIWHHDESHPKQSKKNFGLSLSLWDWIFGTLYIASKDPKEIGL